MIHVAARWPQQFSWELLWKYCTVTRKIFSLNENLPNIKSQNCMGTKFILNFGFQKFLLSWIDIIKITGSAIPHSPFLKCCNSADQSEAVPLPIGSCHSFTVNNRIIGVTSWMLLVTAGKLKQKIDYFKFPWNRFQMYSYVLYCIICIV